MEEKITIPIQFPLDEKGYFGRQCPICEGYFKIINGTGLKGEVPCHCPYCGHIDDHGKFMTNDQIKLIASIVENEIVQKILLKPLKHLEFQHGGISLKIGVEHLSPIHYYRERKLETEVTCSNCSLQYSIYGAFAFCPDCGQANSFQIFKINLDVYGKLLGIASEMDAPISEKLIESALIGCVDAFDGFGREVCRIHSETDDTSSPARISMQNLNRAKRKIQKKYGIDISTLISNDQWKSVNRGFQKRHLISHRLGIIDQEYIDNSQDDEAIVGRKIVITVSEVQDLILIVGALAQNLLECFKRTRSSN